MFYKDFFIYYNHCKCLFLDYYLFTVDYFLIRYFTNIFYPTIIIAFSSEDFYRFTLRKYTMLGILKLDAPLLLNCVVLFQERA